MVDYGDQIVGFLAGLSAGLVTWFVQLHVIVPKIRISANLVKREQSAGEIRPAFRIENLRSRAAHEITVYAMLFVRKTTHNMIFPVNTQRGTDADHVTPYLPGGKKGSARHLYLYPEESASLIASPYMRREFVDKGKAIDVNFLETLFAQDPGAFLRVYVSGYDSLTQSRKFFLSGEIRTFGDSWQWSDRHPPAEAETTLVTQA